MHKAAKQTLILTAIGILALAVSACSNTGGTAGGGDPSIAATVNSRNISLAEVDKLINDQYQGKQSQLSQLELAQVRLQILDGLIQKEVLFQRAEQEKLLPTEDEVTQFINTQMQQAQLTQEQFQEKLKESGRTAETLREEARKALAIQKLQDKVNGKIGVPSEQEVVDFFNGNQQQFVNQRGVGLADIAVDPTVNQGLQDDAKSEAEAKQKIDLIYQQLKSGADFATVARARSEDSYGTRGGDIGFATEDDLKKNGFPPELINKFFGDMSVGSYSEPVQFRGGWYIFKLVSKQLQAEQLRLESPDVRKQITDALINQRKQLLNAALLEVAVNEAKIINNLANNMLNSPNNLSGSRPAQPNQPATTTPAPTAPAVTASPQPSATPSANAAKPSPSVAASPKK